MKDHPLPKKKSKIFSHPALTIYTPIDSPCRVKSSMLFLKVFEVISATELYLVCKLNTEFVLKLYFRKN